MSIDGVWNVTMQTRIGDGAATFDFATQGNRLTGTVKMSMGAADIIDGHTDGDRLTWRAQTAMGTVDFAATVTGESIVGDATLERGSFSFTGTRASGSRSSSSSSNSQSPPRWLRSKVLAVAGATSLLAFCLVCSVRGRRIRRSA